ncbi:nuclear transport factor 2 family protein [Pseudonocardiaceae bacterium YIM PH 21723]|nr:nuclear transport factor 2 family protein [Pseudonocardiaceae bacterium YIM PH 21723]
MSTFRQAVESADFEAVRDLLAEDVVFTSPAVFLPYPGKAITLAILRNVFEVFQDFRYIREVVSADGRDEVLVFQATVGDKQIEGADFIRLNEDGKISEFTVMVRPLSGLQALAEAMGARFEQIKKDAGF